MSKKDPFTGKWEFQAVRSKMNSPGVQTWVQWIEATAEEVKVREDVLSAGGVRAKVTIEARFDGKDYAVRGSSLADAIAYTRPDRYNISGVGKKNGSVTLRETITAKPDDSTLILTFAIFSAEREVANGVAVFQREVASDE